MGMLCDPAVSQFCRLMVKNMNKQEDAATLQEAFNILDKDGSGNITADELKQVLEDFRKGSGEPIEDRDIMAMISEADIDGDGTISFKEVRARSVVAARAGAPLRRGPRESPPTLTCAERLSPC